MGGGMPVASRRGRLAALAALYDGTGGPGWSVSTNWNGDLALGQWRGVTTDATAA